MTPDMNNQDVMKTIRIATGNFSSPVQLGNNSAAAATISDNSPTVKYQRKENTILIREKKSAPYVTLSPQQWVQGWLVAISGPMKGMYFPLAYGYNHVGRASDNQVSLPGDNSISSHQIIIHYNKVDNRFYVNKDHRTTQLTETADGDLISQETELFPGCELMMSEVTTLKFVPFCGENFIWNYKQLPEVRQEQDPDIPADFPPVTPTVVVNSNGNSYTDHLPTEKINEPVAESSRTVRYDRQQDSKTQLFREKSPSVTEFSPLDKKDWVQGWLVAISGPMQGHSFPIRYGYNHIGRSSNCTIALTEDPAVSEEQLLLVYNRKRKIFLLDKSPLTHQVTELADGDIVTKEMDLPPFEHLILTPETTLRFVPFCGDNFSWDYSTTNH